MEYRSGDWVVALRGSQVPEGGLVGRYLAGAYGIHYVACRVGDGLMWAAGRAIGLGGFAEDYVGEFASARTLRPATPDEIAQACMASPEGPL